MQMTYTLTAAQKAKLTREGRKAANKALWAMEKEHRKTLPTLPDTHREDVAKVLRDAAILAVFHEVSQTHTKSAKPKAGTGKDLKRKARKGAMNKNGKLEAQAQAQSLRMAQARAAKSVKTEVVEDITGKRTEVEVKPKNPAKAHVIRKAWVDMPEGMSVEDAFRYATLQDGYGCFEDEVSLDDCM